MEKNEFNLKIGDNMEATKVAGAILELYKEGKEIELETLGKGAVNQTIFAIALANEKLHLEGKTILIEPTFKKLDNGTMCLHFKIQNGNDISKAQAWLDMFNKQIKTI